MGKIHTTYIASSNKGFPDLEYSEVHDSGQEPLREFAAQQLLIQASKRRQLILDSAPNATMEQRLGEYGYRITDVIVAPAD